jgi:hypothetical protein
VPDEGITGCKAKAPVSTRVYHQCQVLSKPQQARGVVAQHTRLNVAAADKPLSLLLYPPLATPLPPASLVNPPPASTQIQQPARTKAAQGCQQLNLAEEAGQNVNIPAEARSMKRLHGLTSVVHSASKTALIRLTRCARQSKNSFKSFSVVSREFLSLAPPLPPRRKVLV